MVNRTLFSQEEEQWKPELIDNQLIATPHCSTVGNFHSLVIMGMLYLKSLDEKS